MSGTITLKEKTKISEDTVIKSRAISSEQSAVKNAIEIRNLTKSYQDFTLDHISFNVPKGYIMGFVGENGAGKTTTIKAILNLLHADSGDITILGSDCKQLPKSTKEQIGVVFDGSSLHDYLSAKHINLIMKNIYSHWDSQSFEDYRKRFELPEKKTVKEYSRGMKMKLSIAMALAHHPKLLILDEATSGLDPIVRAEILDIFQEFIQDEEHTILLSSHIISDIEKIADYVTFIHKGKISFSESKDDLIYRHGVIRCRKEDTKSIDPSYIVGIRENSYGAEVLIRNRDAFQRSYHNYGVEKTSIEEIMLFVSRGKERN